MFHISKFFCAHAWLLQRNKLQEEFCLFEENCTAKETHNSEDSIERSAKMKSTRLLEWPDYLVLAAFLVISLGIGVYHALTGGRQRTIEEFIMANRRLAVIPTALSFFASFQSAITILGMTPEMYMYGIQYLLWVPIGYVIALLLTERLVVPWIYPLQLVSINDVSNSTI